MGEGREWESLCDAAARTESGRARTGIHKRLPRRLREWLIGSPSPVARASDPEEYWEGWGQPA